jgi:hypothetical protein
LIKPLGFRDTVSRDGRSTLVNLTKCVALVLQHQCELGAEHPHSQADDSGFMPRHFSPGHPAARCSARRTGSGWRCWSWAINELAWLPITHGNPIRASRGADQADAAAQAGGPAWRDQPEWPGAARRAAKYIPDGGGWGVHFSIPDASHVVAQHGLDRRGQGVCALGPPHASRHGRQRLDGSRRRSRSSSPSTVRPSPENQGEKHGQA